jgi:hypothetical protein
MGLLGVARANTAVGVSPETFLLLLLQTLWPCFQSKAAEAKHDNANYADLKTVYLNSKCTFFTWKTMV